MGSPASPGGDISLKWLAPGLYGFPQGAGQNCHVYYLDDGSGPKILTFAKSWNRPKGAYLFCAEAIDPSASPDFATRAWALISAGTPKNWHALAWIPGQGDLAMAQWLDIVGSNRAIQTTSPPAKLSVGDISLNVVGSHNPVVGLVDGGFTISAADAGAIVIALNGTAIPLHVIGSPTPWSIGLDVQGAEAGSVTFDVGIDFGRLQAGLGCGFVYGYGYGEGAAAAGLFFPMAAPQKISYSPQKFPNFTLWMNPALPFEAANTRLVWSSGTPLPDFAYQATVHAAPGSPGMSGPGTVYLNPAPADQDHLGGCWGLHSAPASVVFPGGQPYGSPGETRTYLAPVGLWTASSGRTPSPASPPARLDLMAGLALSEFLRIADGETINFVAGQPAHASGFVPKGAPPPAADAPLLDDSTTTAWMQIVATGGGPAARGYYSQPNASPFFAPVPGEPTLIAVEVKVGDLAAGPVFPFVPYGGVGAAPPGGGTPCNPGVPAQTFLRFESQVLGTARHGLLATASEGPVLTPSMPASPPLILTQATTPLGLLIDLYPDGTWSKLTLARSPQASPGLNEVSIAGIGTSPAPFPSKLSLALTQNDLFLVVDRSDAVGAFSEYILVDGFEFRLDLREGAVLVFKFNATTSLADLVASPSLWCEPETFVSDRTTISDFLVEAIEEARQEAKGSPSAENPFAAFLEIVDDPAWAGVITFGAFIDGTNMPQDLQMLLGGMNGPLRAHHFGVQANRITTGGSPAPVLAMDQSSLFGVIAYTKPANGSPPGPHSSPAQQLGYELEFLTVVLSNSKVTQFHAQVGLVMTQLFGRPLTLALASPSSAPDTLVIKGRYQRQNGIGQVIFRTDQPFRFDFVPSAPGCSQVLSSIHFTGASLAPTGDGVTPSGATQVNAQFLLDGELWFSDDPFPVPDPIDIFSYGSSANGGTGLLFTGLGINLSFELYEGATVPGSQVLTVEHSTMQASPTAEAIRANSLLAALPLRFSRFVWADQLAAGRSSAQPVHVLQLESLSGDTGAGSPSSPSSPSMPAPMVSAQCPYSTGSASYALEYDLTLGSLGKMSDLGASVTAKLLLAWGPSPTTPENDAAAVLVQLPQLNAGAAGFSLEGILKTTFGDANLLKVDVVPGQTTYALMFNNVQLGIFGYTFPPGILIDFLLFAGAAGNGAPTNSNNLAWFASARQQ